MAHTPKHIRRERKRMKLLRKKYPTILGFVSTEGVAFLEEELRPWSAAPVTRVLEGERVIEMTVHDVDEVLLRTLFGKYSYQELVAIRDELEGRLNDSH